MNIAVLTQYFKPEMGAPQNRLHEMCTGLRQAGAQVCVVTGMPNYPTGSIFEGYKRCLSRKEVLDGMEVKRYWLYASNSKKALPRVWNMLSFSFTALFSARFLQRKKTEILIVESPPLTLGVTAWILSRLVGARLVLNVSDLWPLSAKELGAIRETGFTYKALARLESFLYRKSWLCMGQSQEIVSYMESHGAKTTYLFRNGVDPSRFSISKDKTDGKAGEHRPLKMVYAGLLGFAQGILKLCEHIDFKAVGAEFHIYGAGGEQKDLERYLSAHPDRGIFYHGKVDRAQIPEVLSQADATLIPLVTNIYGAVPSKIYESMAAGLPIFFSGEGEGRSIVQENNIGWVSNASDFEALRLNIAHVAAHPEELAEKEKNCRRCAEEKFNRPKQIQSLYAFLRKRLG